MLSTEPCTECQVSIETRLGLQSQTPVSYLSLSKSCAYSCKIKISSKKMWLKKVFDHIKFMIEKKL